MINHKVNHLVKLVQRALIGLPAVDSQESVLAFFANWLKKAAFCLARKVLTYLEPISFYFNQLLSVYAIGSSISTPLSLRYTSQPNATITADAHHPAWSSSMVSNEVYELFIGRCCSNKSTFMNNWASKLPMHLKYMDHHFTRDCFTWHIYSSLYLDALQPLRRYSRLFT